MNNVRNMVLAILVAALGIIAYSALFTVHQTQQALVLQFGKPQRVVTEPGLNYKWPFPVQEVKFFDKRVLSLDARAEEVIALDKKRLVVDSIARYRITDPLKFFQTVSTVAGAESRLSTVITSSLRRVLGRATLPDTVSGNRDDQMRQIAEFVNQEAKQFGITIVDVRIKRADLPVANSQAIYRRMQTERQRIAKETRAQGAERAQLIRATAEKDRTVMIAEAQRDAEILRGEGEGQRTKIFADAFNQDPEFFALYRSLQAYRKALGGGDTTMVLSPDSDFFQYFGDIRGLGSKPPQ
jgi:membrane protease subunit HflC